jgi:hypothetical protein
LKREQYRERLVEDRKEWEMEQEKARKINRER